MFTNYYEHPDMMKGGSAIGNHKDPEIVNGVEFVLAQGRFGDVRTDVIYATMSMRADCDPITLPTFFLHAEKLVARDTWAPRYWVAFNRLVPASDMLRILSEIFNEGHRMGRSQKVKEIRSALELP